MKINIPYNFGDKVFLVNDIEQLEHSIVHFIVLPNNILKFVVSYCGDLAEVYEFEVSKTKDLTKSSYGEEL